MYDLPEIVDGFAQKYSCHLMTQKSWRVPVFRSAASSTAVATSSSRDAISPVSSEMEPTCAPAGYDSATIAASGSYSSPAPDCYRHPLPGSDFNQFIRYLNRMGSDKDELYFIQLPDPRCGGSFDKSRDRSDSSSMRCFVRVRNARSKSSVDSAEDPGK